MICPLCRSEHRHPENGFFPSDITRVNLLEINSCKNSCCKILPDIKRGKKIYKVFMEVLWDYEWFLQQTKIDSFPLTYSKKYFLYRQVSSFIKKRS